MLTIGYRDDTGKQRYLELDTYEVSTKELNCLIKEHNIKNIFMILDNKTINYLKKQALKRLKKHNI